jgi:hypothetical protein
MARQCGVISRRQVLELGGDDNLIERRLRRREWARLLPGVYVDHTGPPTGLQRAWGGVLFAAPAALSGSSALRAHRVRGHDWSDSVEVAVDGRRRIRPPDGLLVVRLTDFDRVARLGVSPPRIGVERAVLQVASRTCKEDAAVGTLADACQAGATSVSRLRTELDLLVRLPRRRLLAAVLEDLAAGAMSPLERRYVRDVERAHRLPRAERQQGDGVARDVAYRTHGLFVELDGRLGHEWAADQWRDLDRDLDAAASGSITVRLGWRQVLEPCRTAQAVGRILQARGWEGRPVPCGPGCLLGEPPAPGAGSSP